MRTHHFNFKLLSGFVFATIMLLAASCKKDQNHDEHPGIPSTEMEYIDLGEKEIKANTPGILIDINKDGRKDLLFGTQLVGDPINKVDKRQFLVTSDIDTKLPVNVNEEIPVMKTGDPILLQNFNGYRWFQLSSVVLVQKVTPLNTPVFWEGHWKNATKKYLPFQVIKAGLLYNGWVQLSVSITNEKIVLHKAAISKKADKDIGAGY